MLACVLRASCVGVVQYIDPEFTWKNFTEEEQAKILKAGRSNNTLVLTPTALLFPLFLPCSPLPF